MHEAASAPGARNRGIDTLRGISILLVILNHLGIRLPLAKSELARWLPPTFLRDLNYNGYEAVFVFFVISGFLITTGAQARWGALGSIPARDFYLRRASRILPCLVALVAVLAVLHLAAVPQYTIHRENQSLAGATAAAFGLYLNWYEGATGYLPGSWDVLWSLSIEEVSYLGFPLLCLALPRQRWLVAVLVLLALSMPFTHAAAQGNEIWQEKAYLPGMGAIAVGILAALLAGSVRVPSQRAARALRVLGALGIVAIVFFGRGVWHLLRDGYLLALTLSAAMLILGMHWRGEDARRETRDERRRSLRLGDAVAHPPASLASRLSYASARALPGLGWLRSCGRLSYEIYLTHMFVVFAFVDLARASGSDAARAWIWYPPALACAWLLGRIVARGFTQPCERWLRARYGRPALPPAVPAPARV